MSKLGSEIRQLNKIKNGYINSPNTRKLLSIALTGKKLPDEVKKKISASLKGKKPKNLHLISGWNKGIPWSEDTKKKIGLASLGRTGELSGNWRGGITPKNKQIRASIELRLWRESVFSRDNWTCQDCGIKGVTMNAHHIKSFSKYPELRSSIENGKTLCVPCHRKYRG